MAVSRMFTADATSGWKIPLALAFILVVWIVSTALYNIYLHPLSNYPGPKLWVAFRSVSVRLLFKGDLVHEIEKLHAQYGPIVRTAPDEISVADADGWKDIYAVRPGHKPFPKNPIWWGGKSTGQPESLINAEDPADHERMRRLLSPAFTPKAVEAQEGIVQSYVDLLIQKLRERATAGEDVDIVSWYNFTTFDIIGDLGFGEPFNCLKESQYHDWVATIFSFFKGGVMIAGLRFYPPLATVLMALIPPSVRKPALRNRALSKEKIHRRLNLEKERNDFMTPVIRESDSRSMTIPEIEGTFNTVIVAGSETTATILSGVTNYLTRDPATMNRLRAEVRSSFHAEKDITFSSTKDLPFLNAVIQEGMRMCPPTPAGLPRVVPAGGDTVCGHWFPGGVGSFPQTYIIHGIDVRYADLSGSKTAISVHQWSTYRSPANFHDPLAFIPERWLQSSATDTASPYYNDKRHAVQVFSLGPRNCLGKNLAWAELRLILTRMIWNFDIDVARDANGKAKYLDWTKQKTWILVQKEPLEVRLTLAPA